MNQHESILVFPRNCDLMKYDLYRADIKNENLTEIFPVPVLCRVRTSSEQSKSPQITSNEL